MIWQFCVLCFALIVFPVSLAGPWLRIEGCYNVTSFNDSDHELPIPVKSPSDCFDKCLILYNNTQHVYLQDSRCVCSEKTHTLKVNDSECSCQCPYFPGVPCGGHVNTTLSAYIRDFDAAFPKNGSGCLVVSDINAFVQYNCIEEQDVFCYPGHTDCFRHNKSTWMTAVSTCNAENLPPKKMSISNCRKIDTSTVYWTPYVRTVETKEEHQTTNSVNHLTYPSVAIATGSKEVASLTSASGYTDEKSRTFKRLPTTRLFRVTTQEGETRQTTVNKAGTESLFEGYATATTFHTRSKEATTSTTSTETVTRGSNTSSSKVTGKDDHVATIVAVIGVAFAVLMSTLAILFYKHRKKRNIIHPEVEKTETNEDTVDSNDVNQSTPGIVNLHCETTPDIIECSLPPISASGHSVHVADDQRKERKKRKKRKKRKRLTRTDVDGFDVENDTERKRHTRTDVDSFDVENDTERKRHTPADVDGFDVENDTERKRHTRADVDGFDVENDTERKRHTPADVDGFDVENDTERKRHTRADVNSFDVENDTERKRHTPADVDGFDVENDTERKRHTRADVDGFDVENDTERERVLVS